jgi:protein-tyrosine phosphatase/membrane-associated phospholipid phosphatase
MGHLHGFVGSTRWPFLIRSFMTSVLLSLLFLVVYCSTNWITSQRTDVRTWYFTWELLIPFVPILIFPYMSIDMFFFAAPFLCRDQRELGIFARRAVFSTLAAGTFFLILPLTLVFQRPHVGGWLGKFVDASCSVPLLMALPYNLFPSLHITLRTLLAEIYGRHTRGLLRLLSHIWFSLIGFSTMLTYQHQIVDIAGGFVLAGFAFYLFHEAGTRLPVVSNVRVGFYYALAAAMVLALAVSVWPWGTFLLWPSAGLGFVAAAYFGLGPGIFRKRGGRIAPSARFVLAPVLLGQRLSLVYYSRQCRAWDEVIPNVWIGRTLSDTEAAFAVRQGVTGVLDLTGEFSEAAPFVTNRCYYNLPILDLTAPTTDQLDQAIVFIAAQRSQGVVYVHCKIGYSRSAAVIGAYLIASGEDATAEEAVDRLRRVRPSIIVRPEAMEALRAFERRQKETASVVP